jgi:CheY-like chemotaxis protein
MNRFQDGSAQVVVVESSSTVRSMMIDVVKQLGFSKVVPFEGLKQALGFLEVEQVDWVITSLSVKTPPNGFHLLDILLRYPHLASVRVSFFLEPDEMNVLPQAFKMGLLSWHESAKKATRDLLAAELAILKERFEKVDWNAALVAAQYLDELLEKSGMLGERLELFNALGEVFRDNGWVLARRVEFLHGAGRQAEARLLMAQMQLLGVKEWADISARFVQQGDGTKLTLGIECCAIVEPDEAVQTQLKELMVVLGVTHVLAFSSGEDVVKCIKEFKVPPDLILMEWRIPKVTGSILVQRLRKAGYQTTPIVVVSSLVQQADVNLLMEFGVSQIIEKPIREESFVPQVVKILQQARNPSTCAGLELRIQQLLQAGKVAEAEKLRSKLVSGKLSVHPLMLKFIDSQLLFAQGKYEEARDMALEVVRGSSDHGHARALGVLGRCLSKLHDYENAAKCFERAQKLSPKSLDRLCEVVNAQTLTGNFDAASSALATAKGLDAENSDVKKAEGTLAVHTGNTALANEVFSQIEMLPSLVSELNNQAVSLIHTRNLNAGVELYRKTLGLLPPAQKELVLKVRYNLALAHIRFNFLEKGRDVLNECVCEGKFSVERKIKSLLVRIEETIEKGTPLVLASSTGERYVSHVEAPAEQSEIVAEDAFGSSIAARLGERCCHGLVPKFADDDASVARMLSGAPTFKPRKAIVREASYGADKAIAAK